jgi:hypothetical protein
MQAVIQQARDNKPRDELQQAAERNTPEKENETTAETTA